MILYVQQKEENLFLILWPSVTSVSMIMGRWVPPCLRMLDDVVVSLSVWGCFRDM
jgi:hypothetical protein